MVLAGHQLPGGMLYLGRGLLAASGEIEPALVDSSLKISMRSRDHQGASMDFWPSYHGITPGARGAYLAWLAAGRQDPSVYIGYVFLYFYGLERRALVEIAQDATLRWEIPHLQAEVRRLLRIYQGNSSFRRYATQFLEVLDLLAAAESTPGSVPPPLSLESRWQPPVRLAVELGSFAADCKPVPADWALAWAWYHPEVRLRTPATRCTAEFASLFTTRYTAKYGAGLVIRPSTSMIALDYYAASPGIRSANLTLQIPDVLGQTDAGRRLAAIVDSVSDDLDPYSRVIGRNPDGRAGLAGAALLPPDFRGELDRDVVTLRNWATTLADTGGTATGADVMAMWPVRSAERMAKPEAVSLAQLLARFELGIEPDVRFGGPAINPAVPLVAFRTGPQPPHSATPAYAAATTLLHLAMAVSAADGHVSDHEQQHLVAHLEASLELSAGERARLEAHLRWLRVNGVKLTGLVKRVESLSTVQRENIGDLLITVAAADGVISPEEITSLTKIYKLLGLNPADVHRRLHSHLTRAAPSPATAPVTVRDGRPADPGYPISPPTGTSAAPQAAGVTLDLAAIEAKFAETVAVTALLSGIFADDDPGTPTSHRAQAEAEVTNLSTAPAGAASQDSAGAASEDTDHPDRPAAPSAVPVAGLDAAHSALLQALSERDSWSRPDVTALAARWDLMPEGALDRINEAALETCDEPLLDEDGPDVLILNHYARQELLR